MAPVDVPETSPPDATPASVATARPTAPTNADATPTNANATPSNTNSLYNNPQHPTSGNTPARSAPRNPTNGTAPSAVTTARTTTPPEEEVIFDIPNLERARKESVDEYHAHIKDLHTKMAGGNATDYVESKVVLPRSLQGLRTGQVITRLLAMNQQLNGAEWGNVMADVVGKNLLLGSVNEAGCAAINNLKEIKVEPGRSVAVPPAAKPNNRYYVECLLPYERELHVALIAECISQFPTAKGISMPGKKSFGSTRRVRLYFNTTTAPREVFTPDDENIPIREIHLPCGTAAQVIHKWQRLNQHPPPHLLNRWAPHQLQRSYAAAASTPNPVLSLNNQTQSYAAAAANSSPHPATANPPPPTLQQPAPNTNSSRPQPTQRPGAIPRGPPPHTEQPAHRISATQADSDMLDWDADEPFPAPNTAPVTPNAAYAQPAPTRLVTTSQTNQPRSQPPAASSGSAPPITTTPPNTTNIPQGAQPKPTNTPTCAESAPGAETGVAGPAHSRAPKQNLTHPAPSRSGTDLEQWQQVKRPRTRKPSAKVTSQRPAENTTIQKSASRSRKNKQTNKFAELDFVIHQTFTDDATAPIEVLLPSRPVKPPRRKFKDTSKAITKQVSDAMSHPQQVRHPVHTLSHLSPNQTQIVLRSSDEDVTSGRNRLIRQIALVRSARSNTTQKNIHLDNPADESFIGHVRDRLAECHDPPDCTGDTPIDIPLSSFFEKDELRVRGALCYAWVDLATRAILPHLYDIWPDPPSWNGINLHWLPAVDVELPCLTHASLAAIAACPSLQNIWQHIAAPRSELESAIKTAANQWRLYANPQPGPN